MKEILCKPLCKVTNRKHIVAYAPCYCISLLKEILWKSLPLSVKCEKKTDRENISSLTLFSDFVFLYWRKIYEMSNFALTWIQNKKSNQRKHTVAYGSLFVSLLKENLSNKKGKNGKKREKSYFHVFSIKQRCLLNFLTIFFPFSLFPPKK